MTSLKKIQTFTVVTGTMNCNAKCPDCVSLMTTPVEEYAKFMGTEVDWDNFRIAANLAIGHDADTVLFTGKGEPTLAPDQLLDYLKFLRDDKYSQLAIKEVQTNGLALTTKRYQNDGGFLDQFRENDLRVVSLSIVDTEPENNRQFYFPYLSKYFDLEQTIDVLHSKGFTVRINVTMIGGMIDSPEGVEKVIAYAKQHGIEQVSMRPVRKPEDSHSACTTQYVEANELGKEKEDAIVDYVEAKKDRILDNLMHGARVYQLRGQNLCLTDCLTLNPDVDGQRQLIFFSNGMITYDWANPGAIILGMGEAGREFYELHKNDSFTVRPTKADYKPN